MSTPSTSGATHKTSMRLQVRRCFNVRCCVSVIAFCHSRHHGRRFRFSFVHGQVIAGTDSRPAFLAA
ncbi:hypothetical protein [Andreprevotia sp. IGB-42]|uniref:hypothetical protein n=1 Tax=Andreprevotia sp. IGB-42 TaxID=2497473 RepID=UPI00135A2945|nr:hypothetical protein [Andreprevotia sp. IGB-42]